MKKFEKGIIWEYDPTSDEWARGIIHYELAEVCFIIILFIIKVE